MVKALYLQWFAMVMVYYALIFSEEEHWIFIRQTVYGFTYSSVVEISFLGKKFELSLTKGV